MCKCKINQSVSLSEQKMCSAVSHPVSHAQLKAFVCGTPHYPEGLHPLTPRKAIASAVLILASGSVGRLLVSNRPDVKRGSRAQQCKAYCSSANFSSPMAHAQEGVRMSWNSEDKLNAYPNKLILKPGKGL